MSGQDSSVHSAGWRLARTTLGALKLPTHWVNRDSGGAVFAAASEMPGRDPFHANIVLSVVESRGGIVEDSLRALEETVSMEPWSHVLSINPWDEGRFQRRMQFIYELGGETVAVSKFTASFDTRRIDLTCSSGFDSYPEITDIFDAIAIHSPLEELDL